MRTAVLIDGTALVAFSGTATVVAADGEVRTFDLSSVEPVQVSLDSLGVEFSSGIELPGIAVRVEVPIQSIVEIE